MHDMNEQDTSEKMVFELRNVQPLELAALADCLLSTSAEFQRYLALHESSAASEDVKLLVREVRNGSVVFDLFAACQTLLPEVMQHGKTLLGFLGELKKAVRFLLKQENEPKPESLDKARLERIEKMVQPTARDVGGAQITIIVEKGGNLCDSLTLGVMEANAIQNSVRRELDQLREPVAGYHDDVVLYLFQTRDDTKSETGDKAIIERFGKSPVRTRFATEEAKAKVLGIPNNIFRNAFLVDVRVDTIEDKPVLFTVLRVKEVLPRPEQAQIAASGILLGKGESDSLPEISV